MYAHPARRAGAATLAGAAVVGTSLLGAALATPADAAPASPARTGAATSDGFAKGRVIAAGGLVARSLPTTASDDYGTFAQGKVLSIQCSVRGSKVDGNDRWYLIPAEGYEFVAARYVANLGAAPRSCSAGPITTARTTTTLMLRVAPTTASVAVDTVPAGTDVSVVCKLPGADVGGNPRWYYTRDGRWLSAYYLTNRGAAPDYCR